MDDKCYYPGCVKPVNERFDCKQCLVARYCCKKHKTMHWVTHGDFCKQITSFRREFIDGYIKKSELKNCTKNPQRVLDCLYEFFKPRFDSIGVDVYRNMKIVEGEMIKWLVNIDIEYSIPRCIGHFYSVERTWSKELFERFVDNRKPKISSIKKVGSPKKSELKRESSKEKPLNEILSKKELEKLKLESDNTFKELLKNEQTNKKSSSTLSKKAKKKKNWKKRRSKKPSKDNPTEEDPNSTKFEVKDPKMEETPQKGNILKPEVDDIILLKENLGKIASNFIRKIEKEKEEEEEESKEPQGHSGNKLSNRNRKRKKRMKRKQKKKKKLEAKLNPQVSVVVEEKKKKKEKPIKKVEKNSKPQPKKLEAEHSKKKKKEEKVESTEEEEKEEAILQPVVLEEDPVVEFLRAEVMKCDIQPLLGDTHEELGVTLTNFHTNFDMYTRKHVNLKLFLERQLQRNADLVKHFEGEVEEDEENECDK